MAWDVMSGVTKTAWDVMSGVTKTAWDVLSGVANLCGMFCPGCQKMAWDVLSRDVLSGSLDQRILRKEQENILKLKIKLIGWFIYDKIQRRSTDFPLHYL